MGMALGPVAENGEGLVLENAEIGILVGVDFCGHGKKAWKWTDQRFKAS